MKKTFSHLHTHTEYSLLDGANRIAPLVEAAARDGQKALSITDHGNMHGALRFYNECEKQGVKPIIGCEFYVAMSSRFRKHTRSNGYNHITLLARNEEGYRNLLKLTSLSFIEGMSYKPRIDHELLSRYSGGINCLSGCLSGKINRYILDGKQQMAQDLAAEFQDIFGKAHFWIEVQRNGLKIQDRANAGIIDIAKHIGSPVCATNDIHYLRGEDCDFQDTLLCVNTGSTKADPDRFRFETDHLYVKTQAEMLHVFKDMPEAVYQTDVVSEQVNLKIGQGEVIFPEFDLNGKNPQEALIEAAYLGLTTRYGIITPEIKARVNYELEVIERMGYPEYFLVVQDFISFAKRAGIPVGPGRGSAAGCIVSYALGITDVDPIKHKLLFERFLNPDRTGLPDIDVDFCKERRGEVLDYLKEKHGDDRVAQIATFGRFGPKAAIRDAARVLEVPIRDTDVIAKRMEGETIQECIKKDPALKVAEKDWPVLFKTAKQIEGMVKFSGTHACGVVMGDRPLYELVPLARNTIRKGESVVVTQWDLEDCEKVGLVKFDMLGLETLTTIESCQQLIEQTHGKRVDFSTVDIEDPLMYKALGKGDSEGVFQCFSDAAKRLLIEMQPDCFDDIVAVIALNRPGPLESGIAKQYIDRKHGREPVVCLHEDVETHLSDTYGCMIYQEQIMQLAGALAGFSMGEADGLRKAVGKKDMVLLESIRERWIKGCKEAEKITFEEADSLWDDILKFGRYGFNLSHSASYAYLTAWTAYLRANYTVEFIAANMTQEMEDTERLRAFMKDADKHDITILPPSLTDSGWEFTVVDSNTIRMGIGCVKGLGQSFAKPLENIVWPQNNDLISILRAVPKKGMKRNVLTSLIRSGMLDFCGVDRGCMMEKIDLILKKVREDQRPASGGLFDEIQISDTDIKFNPNNAWTQSELLTEERLAYGYYISGHPMAAHRALVWNSGSKPISYIQRHGQNNKIYKIGGVIVEATVKAVKSGKNKGKKYARLSLEDSTTSIACSVFTRVYEKTADVIRSAIDNATPVTLIGKLDTSSEDPQVVVSAIREMRPHQDGSSFELDFQEGDQPDFSAIDKLLKKHPGDKTVYFNILHKNKQVASVKAASHISLNSEFIEELELIILS